MSPGAEYLKLPYSVKYVNKKYYVASVFFESRKDNAPIISVGTFPVFLGVPANNDFRDPHNYTRP